MESDEAKSKEKESKKVESEEAKSKETKSKKTESDEVESKKTESKETEAQKALSKAMSQVSKLKEELKNLATTAAQTELRSRKEAELSKLKQHMEEATRRHEVELSELGDKHGASIDSLQEQLDDSKRAYQSLEKAKAVLEEDLKSLQMFCIEQEQDLKRTRDRLKLLDSCLAQADREKVEMEGHIHRLQCENVSLTDKLSSWDTNYLRLYKEFTRLESLLHDAQEFLHKVTQEKLALNSLVRALEEEKKGLMERIEGGAKELTQQIQTHNVQQVEVAKTAVIAAEELQRKLPRELDSAIQREQQKEEEKERVKKQKERLSEELMEMTLLMERETQKCTALEKKLRKFEQARRCLAEEKVLSAQLVEERDRAEADIQEKETRHLALSKVLNATPLVVQVESLTVQVQGEKDQDQRKGGGSGEAGEI